MKKFRVTECLIDGVVSEYAIFEGGKRKKIHSDEYGKYFHVDNEYNKNAPSYRKWSFNGRVKDDIQTIRDGNGDVFSVTDMGKGLGAFRSERVRYYVDRTVGEDLRAKTLEGWKNAKFAYCIVMGNKNGFSGYQLLKADSTLWSAFDNLETAEVMTFETEEEAKKHAKDIVRVAREYAGRINSENDYDVVEAEIKEKYGEYSVLFEIIYDLVDENFNGFKNSDRSFTNFGYEINQWLIPSKEDASTEDAPEEEPEPEYETVYLFRCDEDGNITKSEHHLTPDPDSQDLLDVTPPIYYGGGMTDKLTVDFFRDAVSYKSIISTNPDVNVAAELFAEWCTKEIDKGRAQIYEIEEHIDEYKTMFHGLARNNFR